MATFHDTATVSMHAV